MPRQMPGGVPWASALDLEHVAAGRKADGGVTSKVWYLARIDVDGF